MDPSLNEVQCADGGLLREIYKDPEWGQLSMRTILPGHAKAGHVHHRRHEMWVLVRGHDVWITIDTLIGVESFPLHQWHPYRVKPGAGHAVENRGTDEAVILFWSSEVYNPEDPDTEPWSPPHSE